MFDRGFLRHAEPDPGMAWSYAAGRGRGRGMHLQGKGGQYGMPEHQFLQPRMGGLTSYPSKGQWAMGSWGGANMAGWDEDWEEWPDDDDSYWQESLHMRRSPTKGKSKGSWQDSPMAHSSQSIFQFQQRSKGGDLNSRGRLQKFHGRSEESGVENETKPSMKWVKKVADPRRTVQAEATSGSPEDVSTGGAASSADARSLTKDGQGKMSDTAARAARAARLAAEAAAAAAAAAASAGLSSKLEVEDSAAEADNECTDWAEVKQAGREATDVDESDIEPSVIRRGRWWVPGSSKGSESEDAIPTGTRVGIPGPKAKPRDDFQSAASRRSVDRRNFPPLGNFTHRRHEQRHDRMSRWQEGHKVNQQYEPMPKLQEGHKVTFKDAPPELTRSDFFPCNVLKALHREVCILSEIREPSQAGRCVERVSALLMQAQHANLRLEGPLLAKIAETCGRVGQLELLMTVCAHASARLWSYTGQEVADLAGAAAQLGHFDRTFWSAVVVFCATPKPEAFADLHDISDAAAAIVMAAKARAEGVDYALALHGLATAALVQLVNGDAPISDVAEFANSLSHALTVRPLSGGEPLHATPVVEDAICQSVMQVRSELHCASAKDVALISAAIASAWVHMKQMRETEFRPALQDIAQAARFRRYEYTPQDLAIIANSFAKIGFTDVSLTDVLNEQTWSNMSAFSSRDLCLVLSSATRSKDWAEEPFTANVAAEVTVRDLREFSVQELCNLAYSLAKLPHLGPIPINRIADEAFHRQLWLFAPRDKTALVWAMVVVETQQSHQQVQLCQLMIRSLAKTDLATLGAEQASELLWVVSKIGFSDPDQDGLVHLLLRRLVDLKPWMSKVPKHVAYSAWSLSRVRGHLADEVSVWDSILAQVGKLDPNGLTIPELCMLLKACAGGSGKHIVICRDIIFFLVDNLARRARLGAEELKPADLQGVAEEFHKQHRILPPALRDMFKKVKPAADPPNSNSGAAAATNGRGASRATSWHRTRRRHHSVDVNDLGGSQGNQTQRNHKQFGRDAYTSDMEGMAHATSGSEWEQFAAPRRRTSGPASVVRQRRGRDFNTRSWGSHNRDMTNTDANARTMEFNSQYKQTDMSAAWAETLHYSQIGHTMWMMQMAGSMYPSYGMENVATPAPAGPTGEWQAPGYWGPVLSGFGNPYGGEHMTQKRAEGGPREEFVIGAPDIRHDDRAYQADPTNIFYGPGTSVSQAADEVAQHKPATPRQERGHSREKTANESDDDAGRTESPIRRLSSLSLVKDDKLRLNAHAPPGHNVLVRNTFLHVDVPGMADGDDDNLAPLTRSRSCDQLALLCNVPIRSLLDEPTEFQTHPSPQGTAMQRSPSEQAPRLQKSGTKAPPGLRRRRGEVHQTSASGSRGIGLLSSAPPTSDRSGKADQKAKRSEDGTDKEGGKRRGLMPAGMLGGRNRMDRSTSLERKEGKPTMSRASAGPSQVGIAKAAAIISGSASAQRPRGAQQAADGSPGRTGRMPPGRLPEKKHQTPQNAALHRRLEGMTTREIQVLAQQFHVSVGGFDKADTVFRLAAAISAVDVATLKARLAELKVDMSQPMEKNQLEVRLVECIRSRMPPKPARPKATIVQGATGPCLRLEWEMPAVEPKICATSVKLRTPPAGKYKVFDSSTGRLLAKGGSAVSAPMNTAVVQGIEPGIDYEGVVAFHNGAGWGESSDPSVPTCVGEKLTASKPNTPDPPILSEISVPGSTESKLKVSWKIPQSWPPVEVCSVQVTDVDKGTMGFVDADSCQIVSRGGAAMAVPQCEVVVQNAEPLTSYAARIFVKSAHGFGEPSPPCVPHLFRGVVNRNSENTGESDTADASLTTSSATVVQPVTEPANEAAQNGDSGGTGEGEGGRTDKNEKPGSGEGNGGTGESGGVDDGDANAQEAETGAATPVAEAVAPGGDAVALTAEALERHE